MPATLTYPGVYIEEIPSGVRTIVGVATSITAFIGYTARGPLDRAARIHNFGDFEREFGGLHRDSLVSYAVQQFFLNGGSDAYVVRVAKNSKAATVTLGDISVTPVLKVCATSPGVWANDVRIDIDYATSNPDSTFNLTATRYEMKYGKPVAVETERHINLSMNSKSATYAVDVVNAASKIIRMERLIDTSGFSNRGWSLSGNLSAFSSGDLVAGDTISGILNGTRTFLLRLESAPNDLDELVSALESAISIAGLSTFISADRANADGTEDATGNFLKLTSNQVPGDSGTDAEHSSVEITSAPPGLKLGLAGGGREKEGASWRRPAPTGTISPDLSVDLDLRTEVHGSLVFRIMDNSQTPAVQLMGPATVTVEPPEELGSELASQLQELIRGTGDPATKDAKVQFQGQILRIQPSADNPNVILELTDSTLDISGGTTLDLHGAGGLENVQQFRLGTGPELGAQSAAEAGLDGIPPDTGTELKGSFSSKTGIYALRDVDLFNLMVIPETSKLNDAGANSVIQEAVTFCEEERAFYIIDPNPKKNHTQIADWAEGASKSRNAAVFFPEIQIADPLNGFRLKDMPPSGAVAGIFARTDGQRGVWKAPAGTDAVVKGAQGVKFLLTDLENGPLNQKGVNCLRNFPVYGIISWGARTRRGADEMADEYKYIPVRRLALYLEESLYRGLKWVVFEPNDEPLWSQIRLNVGAFMHNLFRQGAFQGTTPKEAYFVKCDKETTTQNDINLGIVNILVGFAPLKPAEFVVIKIQQMAGQVQT